MLVDDRTIVLLVMIDEDPPVFENRIVDRGGSGRTTKAATVPLQRIFGMLGARDATIIISTVVVRELDQTKIMLVFANKIFYGRGGMFLLVVAKKYDIAMRFVGTSGIRAMHH